MPCCGKGIRVLVTLDDSRGLLLLLFLQCIPWLAVRCLRGVMANSYDYYAGQGYSQQQGPNQRPGQSTSNRGHSSNTVPMPLPRYASKRSWETPTWQQQQQQGPAYNPGANVPAWAATNSSSNGQAWSQRGRYETRPIAGGDTDVGGFGGYVDAPMGLLAPLPFPPPTPDAGWPPPLSSVGVPVSKPLPPDYRPRNYRDLDNASTESNPTVAIARPISHPLEQAQQSPQRAVGVLTMLDANRGLIQSSTTGSTKVVFHVSQCSNSQQKQAVSAATML